jgi:hypothetical protein
MEVAAPLAQDRLEMAQCVVVAIECIRLLFRKCDWLPHCRGREDEIARQREQDSKSKSCLGRADTSYPHGAFPNARGFTGYVDRKLQKRSFASLKSGSMSASLFGSRSISGVSP